MVSGDAMPKKEKSTSDTYFCCIVRAPAQTTDAEEPVLLEGPETREETEKLESLGENEDVNSEGETQIPH